MQREDFLWLLGRMQRRGSTACTYEEAETPVSQLLREFGPSTVKRYAAAMPFVHLESDLWEFGGDDGASVSDTRASLCRAHARGRLRPEVEEFLRPDPSLIAESARLLIDLNFTPTYLDPICADVGLGLEVAEEVWRHRTPAPTMRTTAWRCVRCTTFCSTSVPSGSTPISRCGSHRSTWRAASWGIASSTASTVGHCWTQRPSTRRRLPDTVRECPPHAPATDGR